MLFDPFYRHSPSALQRAIQEVQVQNLCQRIFGHTKVEFRQILPIEWRGRWPMAAKRLMELLEREGYQPEPYNMVYPLYHGARDIDLILCRNSRHVIGWWPKDVEAIELEMIYRYVAWEDNRESKARDFIQTFNMLCKEAGFRRVELQIQPFGLHPRLPYRNGIKSDPDISPQKKLDALKELYSHLGFKESGKLMTLAFDC